MLAGLGSPEADPHPLAAVGLGLVMVGAMITHARLGETDALPINIGLLVLSIAVAAVRFIQL